MVIFPITCTSCQNLLDFCDAPIAQLVEQIPLKDKVVGSIPTGRTKIAKQFLN